MSTPGHAVFCRTQGIVEVARRQESTPRKLVRKMGGAGVGATLTAPPGVVSQGRTWHSLLVDSTVLVEVKLLEDPVRHVHELLGEVEVLHHGGHVPLLL